MAKQNPPSLCRRVCRFDRAKRERHTSGRRRAVRVVYLGGCLGGCFWDGIWVVIILMVLSVLATRGAGGTETRRRGAYEGFG